MTTALRGASVDHSLVKAQTPRLGERRYKLERAVFRFPGSQVKAIQFAIARYGVHDCFASIDGRRRIDGIRTKEEALAIGFHRRVKGTVPKDFSILRIQGKESIRRAGHVHDCPDPLRSGHSAC